MKGGWARVPAAPLQGLIIVAAGVSLGSRPLWRERPEG
jgi:hypothetical protein